MAAVGRCHCFTPRSLMKRVAAHIDWCMRHGRMEELESLVAKGDGTTMADSSPLRPPGGALDELDRRFESLVRLVDVDAAFDPATEDGTVPGLLSAGLAPRAGVTRVGGSLLLRCGHVDA
jgi:hypothetical protein